ncbi:MAG: TorF family putative porin [Burkholderiales bacterium]
MRKTLIAVAVGVALSTPVLASADEPGVATNVTLASEYLYRGIAQTRGKPAIQGGFDYAFSNGLYIGTWGSNISWLSDVGAAAGTSASMEWDVYGGYKGSISKDLGYDVGILTYNYPGTNLPTSNADPNTIEIYGALSYKWFTAKYSVTTGSLFGYTNPTDGSKTTGSGYLDLTGTYDMGNGLSLVAHLGNQSVHGYSDASYSDYMIGVSKDVAKVGTFSAALIGTDANGDCGVGGVTNPYCFGTYNAGKSRLLVTFGKSF